MWRTDPIRAFNRLASHYNAENEGSLVEALQASLVAMNFWVTLVDLHPTWACRRRQRAWDPPENTQVNLSRLVSTSKSKTKI
tara:strand:- start:259 stop:504 length:246 start_codon:yes stop_codon:yes gene_type:complete